MSIVSFKEFLELNGVNQGTLDYLKECYETGEAVSVMVHSTMMKYFKYYVLVGANREAVETFVKTHDLEDVKKIQDYILDKYRVDMGQKSRIFSRKIQTIFDMIPRELDKANKRFMLADIRKSARMERYDKNFEYLYEMGMAVPVNSVLKLRTPLRKHEKENLFKLYYTDSGIMCRICGEEICEKIHEGDFSVLSGSILETAFVQNFIANGTVPRYFAQKGAGEADFVIEKNNKPLPMLIRADVDYRNNTKLEKCIEINGSEVKEGIVFAMCNVEKHGSVKYYPWYMLIFL